MDTASLPYLQRIAKALELLSGSGSAKTQGDALVAIAKSISASANSETTINEQGNANTAAIAEKLDKGLLTEVQDGSTAVIKSLLEVLRTALVEELHSAMMVTVQEQQGGQTVNVEKSVFEVMKDEIVKAVHDELTTTVEISGTPTEVNVAYLMNGIMTANQAIATAMSGLGTVIGQIQTNTANTAARLIDSNDVSAAAHLAQIKTDTNTIKGDIDDSGAIKDDVNTLVTNTGSSGALWARLNQIETYVNNIRTDIEETGGIKADIEAIRVNTGNIHTDLYDNGTAITQLRNLSSITTTTNNIAGYVDNVETQLNQILDKCNDIYNRMQ